jgi:hypothetical protein
MRLGIIPQQSFSLADRLARAAHYNLKMHGLRLSLPIVVLPVAEMRAIFRNDAQAVYNASASLTNP